MPSMERQFPSLTGDKLETKERFLKNFPPNPFLFLAPRINTVPVLVDSFLYPIGTCEPWHITTHCIYWDLTVCTFLSCLFKKLLFYYKCIPQLLLGKGMENITFNFRKIFHHMAWGCCGWLCSWLFSGEQLGGRGLTSGTRDELRAGRLMQFWPMRYQERLAGQKAILNWSLILKSNGFWVKFLTAFAV